MTYTKIIEIIAPLEAASGELVNIEVRVKNIWADPFYIGVTGRCNDTDIPFSPDYAVVDPGTTYSFSALFTMPDNDIRLEVWSWYWAEAEWIQDDYAFIDIALAVEEEEEAPVSLLPLVVVGGLGLGVLGVGAAVALAARPRG